MSGNKKKKHLDGISTWAWYSSENWDKQCQDKDVPHSLHFY